MSIAPTLESTPARRCDAIVNSLLRGLFLDTGSKKALSTEGDSAEHLFQRVRFKILRNDHFNILIDSGNVASKAACPTQNLFG